MITVCSRCKRVINQALQPEHDEKVSHGICARCLAILEERIKKNPKSVSSVPPGKVSLS